MLRQLLAAVADRRVFICCRTEPKPNGGTNKIPINPTTGAKINPHDPANWMTLDAALSFGQHVGIVIHEGCGLAAIDIDHCWLGDRWSDFALAVCARFPNAYRELGHSQTGLHLFFTIDPIPEHKTRNNTATSGAPDLEVYTRARFIMLTGIGGAGDITANYTPQLQQLIAELLPGTPVKRTEEWTTEPFAGWRGGGTDEQIIEMMRNRRPSASAAFGDGATFSDLFDANVDALARAFPTNQIHKAYDGSSADQALANHLAWATGYDCERTQRLMWMSALRRDKWEREDYLPRTILRAIAGKIPAAQTSSTALEAPLLEAPEPPTAPDPLPIDNQPTEESPIEAEGKGELYNFGKYTRLDQQERLFEGCVYVEDANGILLPSGTMLDKTRFDIRFSGREYQTRFDGTKSTESAWDAFTDSKMKQFPRVNAMTFDPRLPPRETFERDGLRYINSYVPLRIEKTPGDVAPFLTHARLLYPNGNDFDILISYLAFLVQYQGHKAAWAILLQGVPGNGKTFFSLVMEYCIGQRYTYHARASQLDSRFNAAFYGKLLICVEDVYISEGKETVWEALKPMITDKRMEIEGKGLDKVDRDVCFNFIMNSNHRNGIRKTDDDRRIAPLFGAQQYKADLAVYGMNESYFRTLYDWLSKQGGYQFVAHYLSTYAIPDALNPAVDCIRAPHTTSTYQAVSASRGTVEQEIIEAIAEQREGFRGGWISSVALDRLLKEIGKARYVPRTRRGELLEVLGYELHPGVPNGRVLLPDGTGPQLYCTKKEHPALRLTDAKAIIEAFTKAQAPT